MPHRGNRLGPLIRQVRWSDLQFARFASRPAAEWPTQVRLYSNGHWSAAARIVNRTVVDFVNSHEDSSSSKAISALLKSVSPWIQQGTGVVYVGAINNEYRVREKSATSAPGEQSAAFVEHEMGADAQFLLRASTKVQPDVEALLQTCAEQRIVMDVYDEGLSLLSLFWDTRRPFPEPMIILMVVEHAAYVAIVHDKELWAFQHYPHLLAQHGFESPDFPALANSCESLLTAMPGDHSAAQVQRIIYCDLRSEGSAQGADEPAKDAMTAVFSQAAFVPESVADIIANRGWDPENKIQLNDLNHAPLAMFAHG